MKPIRVWTGLLAVAITLPTPALATNGYFTHGYGTEYKGMAGAGSALALDALAGATNPAALAFVGARNDVGLALFNPNRDYTVVGAPSGYPGTFGLAPGKVTSHNQWFPIPSVAIARPFGARQSAGLMLYANGGMSTDYHSATFGNTPTGVDLQQLFIGPTYARRLAARHALGATAVLGYQRFAANGLAAFGALSADPGNLSNRGYASAVGAGVRVGYIGGWARWLSVAASYQSPVWMSKFGRYAGLFRDQGSFNVPSSWTAGIVARPNRRVDLVADVQRTNYSEVDAIGQPMLPNLVQQPLGSGGSAGFGWKDVTTWKLGAQVRTGQAWTWRGGYSFGDQPIPASEVLFNILAPAVVRQHATLGFTRQLAGGRAVSAAVMRAFSNTVSGPNALEAPGQQHIDLHMDEWEFEVGYAWAIR